MVREIFLEFNILTYLILTFYLTLILHLHLSYLTLIFLLLYCKELIIFLTIYINLIRDYGIYTGYLEISRLLFIILKNILNKN